MILNLVYISKNLYTFNEVKFRPIYLLLGLSIISLYIVNFSYLVNVLTSTKSIIRLVVFVKADIYI